MRTLQFKSVEEFLYCYIHFEEQIDEILLSLIAFSDTFQVFLYTAKTPACENFVFENV